MRYVGWTLGVVSALASGTQADLAFSCAGSWEPGTFLVRLSSDDFQGVRLVEERLGVSLRERLPDRWFVFEAHPSRPVADLLRAVGRLPGVVRAQPNYFYRAVWHPNDPLYPLQWGLPAIAWPEGMDVYRGRSDVRVAVVDTGVQHSHPDLWPNVTTGWNTIENNANSWDDNGHGTMVAGVIGAVTNNGLGIAGTAPNVRLVPVKALDRFAQGTTANVVEAIQWAVANGCHVINLSLGGTEYDPALEEACSVAWAAGVVLVGAAGNSGGSWPIYPGAYEVVVNVGGTSRNDVRWWWSQHNWGTEQYVDVAAPGDGIASTLLGSTYAMDSGTSYAAGYVSGLAALLYGARAGNLSYVPRTAENAGAVRRYVEYESDYVGDWVRFGRIHVQRSLLRATRATVTGTVALPGHVNPRSVLVVASLMSGSHYVESRGFYPGEDGAFEVLFTRSGLFDLRFETPGRPFLARRELGRSVAVGETLTGINVSLPGGDANRDLVVDLQDLSLVLVHFDRTYSALDLDGSGRIDTGDIVMVLVNFSKSADP